MRELTSNPLARRVLLGLFLGALGLGVATVLAPFLIPLAWAGILGYATWPLFLRLEAALGGRDTLAAAIMTVLVALSLVLPFLWLTTLLRVESTGLADALMVALRDGSLKAPDWLADLPLIGADIARHLDALAVDPARIKTELLALAGHLDQEGMALLGGIGRNLAKLAFALFALFFVYQSGRAFAAQSRHILVALLGGRANGYLDAVAATTRAVVYGIVLTALVQGAVAGIGYWVAGLPAPATLAAITVLLALIPFGTPVVWGAAGLWLLFTGQTWAGAGLLLWGALVVSWVDNIVRPLILAGAANIPFILALFGVLGGLAAFGLVGLFLGPVILAVALAVWREWLEGEAGVAE
ncbi:MAG: AI-2E family transporter [Sulfuricella sp.]|nr:AI-2E family transporter [Gammaproteobacteria bacterium]